MLQTALQILVLVSILIAMAYFAKEYFIQQPKRGSYMLNTWKATYRQMSNEQLLKEARSWLEDRDAHFHLDLILDELEGRLKEKDKHHATSYLQSDSPDHNLIIRPGDD